MTFTLVKAPPTLAPSVSVSSISITSTSPSEPFVAANDDVVAPIVNDTGVTAL